ncbi:YdfR family protein, partial [Escherichia coli]|nr:YdfR family protein [Escherichia coli]
GLDISLDRVEGAALEFYEAAARRSIRQVFLDVAAGLCEGGDELLPETRSCSKARYTIKINSSDNSITGC